MFTTAFEKNLNDTYCHDLYEDYNELGGLTKEQHIENMRCKSILTDKLIEELKNYESIYFGYYLMIPYLV